MGKRSVTTLWMIVLVLFVLLFVLFMYTFLHEAGHTLAGVYFGQSVTEFKVNFWTFDASVGLVGGEISSFQHAVQSAAGAGLPFLVWVVFMLLVARKCNFILETVKLVSSLVVINTLLPWIIIPLLFLLGKAPSDDVTNFLIYSQVPPVLLTLFALLLYIGGWILFLSKIEGLPSELSLFRDPSEENLKAGARSAIPVMAGLMAVCAIAAITLNIQAGKNAVDKYTPPPGFGMVSQVDLAARPYNSEPIWQFTLNEPAFTGVFIVINNIDTTYFDLIITGPEDYNSTIIHGEGYKAGQDGGLWEHSLPAGTYQLVLTSLISQGMASVYLNIR